MSGPAPGGPLPASSPFVLICGLDHADVAEEEAVFREAGVRFGRVAAPTEDDLLRQCGGADALLVQYARVSRRVVQGLPRLRLVVRYGVGVDGVDVAAATERGIPVANVPDYGTDEVANHAVALLRKGVFVTADEAYFRKVGRRGGVALLRDFIPV